MKRFSAGVSDKIGHYVYRLIDPRNGQTFYVGRGQRDRLFAHVHAESKIGEEEPRPSDKLETIKEIRRAGLEVTHVVHRHGLVDEKTASEVEAALMDAYPGLTNVAPGQNQNRGVANAQQLERLYAARVMVEDPGHKLMYIKVLPATVKEKGLYEAVRRSWRVNRKNANQADYVLALVNQIVKGVFADCKWGPSLEDIPSAEGKSEFVGREIFDGEIVDAYSGTLIPDKYRKLGMAGSWFYSWTGAD